MRKFLSLFMLLLVITAFSACEDKKQDDTEILPEETVQEETSEPVFRELSFEDFKDVNMNIRAENGMPPFDVHSINLADFDFGEKMSPCKAENVRDEFMNDYSMDAEYNRKYKEYCDKICSDSAKGLVSNAVMGDGKIFLEVNYDNYCYNHCKSLFSYDIQTEKLVELIEFSSLEDEWFDFISWIDGKLVAGKHILKEYSENGNSIYENILYQIDTSNGDCKELFSETGKYHNMSVVGNHILTFSINSKDDDNTVISYYEYNFDTGKLENIYSCENDYLYPILYNDEILFDVVTENDDSTVSVNTPDYIIKTDHNTNTLEYKNISPDMVSLVVNNKLSYVDDRTLYVYNLNTMERYICDFDGYGSEFSNIGKNMISYSHIMNSKNFLYFIMPRIGTAFKMYESTSIYYRICGDNVIFIQNIAPMYFDFNIFRETSESNPDTVLYWFEMKN